MSNKNKLFLFSVVVLLLSKSSFVFAINKEGGVEKDIAEYRRLAAEKYEAMRKREKAEAYKARSMAEEEEAGAFASLVEEQEKALMRMAGVSKVPMEFRRTFSSLPIELRKEIYVLALL